MHLLHGMLLQTSIKLLNGDKKSVKLAIIIGKLMIIASQSSCWIVCHAGLVAIERFCKMDEVTNCQEALVCFLLSRLSEYVSLNDSEMCIIILRSLQSLVQYQMISSDLEVFVDVLLTIIERIGDKNLVLLSSNILVLIIP